MKILILWFKIELRVATIVGVKVRVGVRVRFYITML